MSKIELGQIVESGDIKDFVSYFYQKDNFAEAIESLAHYEDEEFTDIQKLGEFRFKQDDRLMVVSMASRGEIGERRSRKTQYEKGRRILKDSRPYDSGIFIFYNRNKSFRFSLIYKQFLGTHEGYSNYRRFTYFVERDQKNRTFIDRVSGADFSSLNGVKDAFSVEKVTKDFYTKIAGKFTELVGGERKIGSKTITEIGILKLPSTTDPTTKKEFAVRLIGRLLFCWFLKRKVSPKGIPLIPGEILSSKSVNACIENGKNYYHDCLEPLFFEMLNTPLKARKDGVRNEITDHIPFLNGGLFEPHIDDYYETDNRLGISKHINTLLISNAWFKELFEGIFEIYNFTIDESTSLDIEISIDPEMLGRIFENLLAEINPETGETARKATGSYYTPRAIVEYMVDESLKHYLITRTEIKENKLSKLLSYQGEAEINLSDHEKDLIIDALDRIRIIDPACGSGAFPMGVLQKMLLILREIDPQSMRWFHKKLSHIDDPLVLKRVEEKFKSENWDYIHKIGIIQSSIYGVDIQPIAIEIAKLRFFLSLVVDDEIDEEKENRGVDPLPNLEFKFVTANTLISLPKANGALSESKEDIIRLKDLRDSYFTGYGTTKRVIEEEIKKTQVAMFKRSLEWTDTKSKSYKLAEWDPFSNKTSSWFDPEWMFGIKDGFDIVIGNPPYGFRNVLTKGEKEYFRKVEKIQFSSGNSAELFSTKCFENLVKANGILTFIIPKKSLYGDSWESFRSEYWNRYSLKFLLDTSKAFDQVLLEANAFGLEKNEERLTETKLAYLSKNGYIVEFALANKDSIYMENRTFQMYRKLYPDDLYNKIQDNRYDGNLVIGRLGLAIGTDFFSESKTDYKLLKGIDIQRWKISSYRFLKNVDRLDWEQASFFLGPKVLCQRVIAHIEKPFPHIKIVACFDEEGIIITNTLISFEFDKRISHKFWLAYLNSSFVSWYAYNFIYSRAIRTMDFYNFYIQQLPIPKKILVDASLQQSFDRIVDKILSTIRDKDYQHNTVKKNSVKQYEKQIDQMVYELYELTADDTKIIENSSTV